MSQVAVSKFWLAAPHVQPVVHTPRVEVLIVLPDGSIVRDLRRLLKTHEPCHSACP